MAWMKLKFSFVFGYGMVFGVIIVALVIVELYNRMKDKNMLVSTTARGWIVEDAKGYFEAGHDELGFPENGVQLSEMKYTKELIPEWLLVELAGLKALTISGEYVIPASEEELETF
jgi:hypothetical protein